MTFWLGTQPSPLLLTPCSGIDDQTQAADLFAHHVTKHPLPSLQKMVPPDEV